MARLQPGLVYIGIKKSVVALDRRTGEIRWEVKLPVKYASATVSGLPNVWYDTDALFVACAGEMFCLDPKSGTILWQNVLKGMGTGFVSISTEAAAPRSASTAVAAAALANAAAARSAAT